MKILKRILTIITIVLLLPCWIYSGIKWIITGNEELTINNKNKILKYFWEYLKWLKK